MVKLENSPSQSAINCFLFHSEPSVRGILNSFSGIVLTFGLFAAYLLGSFIPWRHVSYACAIVPALNILISLFVCIRTTWFQRF